MENFLNFLIKEESLRSILIRDKRNDNEIQSQSHSNAIQSNSNLNEFTTNTIIIFSKDSIIILSYDNILAGIHSFAS